MKAVLPLLFIAFLTITLRIYADDIYLKTGKVIKNVVLKDSTEYLYVFNTHPENQTRRVSKDQVYIIEKLGLDSSKSTYEEDYDIPKTKYQQISVARATSKDIIKDPCNDKLLQKLSAKDSLTVDEMKIYVELRKLCEESRSRSLTMNNEKKPLSLTKTTYPNLILLPIGIVAGVVSYNAFRDYSDYSDAIEALSKVNISSSELEHKKNNKLLLGILSGAASLVLTVVSLDPVEVEIGSNQVALSYRYSF